MTSGEVLFILAFIVLPTTVLVSSIWAVVFVRRRPQRVIPEQFDESAAVTRDVTPDAQETALVTAVERPSATQTPVENQVAAEPAETFEEPTPEPDSVSLQPEIKVAEPEPQMAQPTEDLDEIVARITELESVVEPLEPVDPGADETQEPAEELVILDQMDEPAFTQTSELPVVDPFAQGPPQPQPEPRPDPDERQAEPEGVWKRRRRDVRLRPADGEAPRKRGRSRDSDRQVPQLGRTTRRRDGSQRETPPDHGDDHDSISGNR